MGKQSGVFFLCGSTSTFSEVLLRGNKKVADCSATLSHINKTGSIAAEWRVVVIFVVTGISAVAAAAVFGQRRVGHGVAAASLAAGHVVHAGAVLDGKE